MKNKLLLPLLILLFCFMPFLSACNGEDNLNSINTSQRGNTDGNLHELGLTTETEKSFSYIGTTDVYDLIYRADQEGNAEKAVTGLTGYIRYLNYLNGTYWFIGITYDENNDFTDSIFSYEESTDTKECVYELTEGESITYFNVIGNLLIFAVNRNNTTEIRAVNIKEKTEAVLLKSNHVLYDINIVGSSLYYIEENSIKKADLNGKNKATVYTAKSWLGHLVMNADTLYFINEEEDGDTVVALKEGNEKPTVLYSNTERIDHLNIADKGLVFTLNRYSDGELSGADIMYYGFADKKTTELTTVEGEYIGIEVAADYAVIHLNDDALSVMTVKLP